MRACIHGGARTRGGNCVEIEADSCRLVIDVGAPLSATSSDARRLPPIPGLIDGADPTLVGVLVSHGHRDHVGLAELIHSSVPVYAGQAVQAILKEASFYAGGGTMHFAGHLRDRTTLELGPFRITPYLVDHSGFDAYALLVEAGGRSVFYSGDLRLHGRKARTMERLLDAPPTTDVLILEGTHVTARGGPEARSEVALEEAALRFFDETEGLALLLFSPQNIDRLVTLFRAAKRASRTFVYDLYAADVARATGRTTIPQAEWSEVRVYPLESQLRKVNAAREFARTKRILEHRIYPSELARRPDAYALLFRREMGDPVEKAGCLHRARALWSQSTFYLATSQEARWLAEKQIPRIVEHTTGHATASDLQRVASAFAPARIVPIHTDAPELFGAWFTNVELHADGEWWEV